MLALVTALAVGGGMASLVQGHLLYVGGNFAHPAGSIDWFLNELTGTAHDNARAAQLEWHSDTNRDLSSTSSHDTSIIHTLSKTYGLTGWVGLGEYCYHCTHLHVRQNLSYSAGDSRTVACQEIGHTLGEDHHSGDCMGYSYFTDWSPYVGSHTISEIDAAWAAAGHAAY